MEVPGGPGGPIDRARIEATTGTNTHPVRPRFYLDHAATSHPKPPRVWDAVLHQGRDVGSSAGRSNYREAIETDQAIDRARASLARLLGGTPERVAFTLNTTDALNMALKGILKPGDHVVTTVMEHNSVIRPLKTLEHERGVETTLVPASDDGSVDPGDILEAVRPGTRLIAMIHASNVCGTRLPVRAVGEIAHQRDILFLVDAAQTAGTVPIDLGRDRIDILAVPGHKGLLGPLGTGALLLGEEVEIEGLRQGGTGTHSEDPEHPREFPWRLEAGSQNAPGIAGLGAAVEYLLERGVSSVRSHLEELTLRLRSGLEGIPGLICYGPRDHADHRDHEPIYLVNLRGYDPAELSAVLDSSFGIQTRAGLHCAPGAHRVLGTYPEGACRISLGCLSTTEDVNAVLEALAELARASHRGS